MSEPPKDVRPARGLWAAVAPADRGGGYFIDYRSISYAAKIAREYASEGVNGGWPDLRKRGWRIIRVDVVPSEGGNGD